MRLVHDKKPTLDHRPLFLDLGVGGSKSLARNVLCLGNYLLGLLLNVGKSSLGPFIASFHVFKICIDRALRRFKKAADLRGSLGKIAALAYLDLISVELCLKLRDLRLEFFYLLLLIVHDHHHFVL